jgi:hypothetical protein
VLTILILVPRAAGASVSTVAAHALHSILHHIISHQASGFVGVIMNPFFTQTIYTPFPDGAICAHILTTEISSELYIIV